MSGVRSTGHNAKIWMKNQRVLGSKIETSFLDEKLDKSSTFMKNMLLSKNLSSYIYSDYISVAHIYGSLQK